MPEPKERLRFAIDNRYDSPAANHLAICFSLNAVRSSKVIYLIGVKDLYERKKSIFMGIRPPRQRYKFCRLLFIKMELSKATTAPLHRSKEKIWSRENERKRKRVEKKLYIYSEMQ